MTSISGSEPVKIVILNGSPRKNGKIASLMKYARQLAGPEGELIQVYEQHIYPCTGCMRCRETGKCCLPEDDGQRLSEKIGSADVLIVGTPTHWGNMSAGLKNMFDRMVPVFMGESKSGIPKPRQKGKRAIIVATCSTPWPFNILFRQSRGAVRAVEEILKTAGYRTRRIEIGGTKKQIVLLPKYYKKMAAKMNKPYQTVRDVR